MKVKITLVFVMALFVLSCANIETQQSSVQVLKGALIKKILKPPVYSGLIAAYTKIYLDKDGNKIILLYPYFEDEMGFPDAGNRCDFWYEVQRVEGQVGDHFMKNQTVAVITNFSCK